MNNATVALKDSFIVLRLGVLNIANHNKNYHDC